jgi:hypothetical protein
MPNDDASQTPVSINREKALDYVSRYANYSYLESSLWDLKIHFGQTDVELGNTVPINTKMTLSWPQVKVLHYFLSVHLSGYEAEHGRIKIPSGIIRTAPSSVPSAMQIYEKFMEENPEAKPEPE